MALSRQEFRSFCRDGGDEGATEDFDEPCSATSKMLVAKGSSKVSANDICGH